MRVLVNTLTVEGLRTGVGHYASELVRCLRALAGRDAVGTFPSGWLRRARAVWTRLSQSPAVAVCGGQASWWDELRRTSHELRRLPPRNRQMSQIRPISPIGCPEREVMNR